MIHKDLSKEKVLEMTEPCRCEACTVGCRFGSGVLADEDHDPLAEFLHVDDETLKKEYLEEIKRFNTKRWRPKIKKKEGKPYGSCIFFDEYRGCMVHPVKPLECRVSMGCKDYGEDLIAWFNLDQFVDEDDPESLREWRMAHTGKKTIKGGSFEELVPDEKTRKSILEYEDKRLS